MIGSGATRGVRRVAPGMKYGISDAVRLLITNRILLVTTIMYLLLNLGGGLLYVSLPVYADVNLAGGAGLYGILLACAATGEMLVAIATGLAPSPRVFGIAICVARMITGFSVLLLLPGLPWMAGLGLMISGAASGPLTIWAQTPRMQIIPDYLRGRTFALLRTLMQGAGPIGGLAGGLMLPVIGMTSTLTLAALTMGFPGLFGLRSRHLRHDDLGLAPGLALQHPTESGHITL